MTISPRPEYSCLSDDATMSNGIRESVHSEARGQALTEFALTIPLLLILIMATFEFGLAMVANVSINRAAQTGAHMASIAGNTQGADCLILDEVERSITAPNDRSAIQNVQIQRTSLIGEQTLAANDWARDGSTDCTLNNGDVVTVPYSRVSGAYPNDQRCNMLGGCPLLTPARTTVDNIGVAVRYQHDWKTPLGSLVPLVGGDTTGWTFEQRDIFRMEPHL